MRRPAVDAAFASVSAEAHFVRNLGVRARHERSHLLVPHLNQLGVAAGATENPVDGVARTAVIRWFPVRANGRGEIGCR
jgi:hypothetical protein